MTSLASSSSPGGEAADSARVEVPWRRVGRYSLFDEVGHGGTATVHIGRWLAPGGFTKTVAIKRLHQNVARDAEVQAMFLDEARLASRIRHVNVVAMLDFLALAGETFLVMEYVHGASLSSLNRALWERDERVPARIAARISSDALAGLAAAHAATTDAGEPLGLIHRDVSPHNLQVGVDGVCRILDFGIAKALGRLQDTHTGQLKGKLAYMAPEQLLAEPVDQRADLFAAGVVLWETLAGRRLFAGDAPGQTVRRIVLEAAPPLEQVAPELPAALCAVVNRAVARNPAQRFASAADMLHALEAASELASSREVGAWLQRVGGEALRVRSQRLRDIESLPLSLEDSSVAPARMVITTGGAARADDLTRSDLRATFPSFSDTEVPAPSAELTLIDAVPQSGIRRGPRSPARPSWRWAVPGLAVAAALALLLGRRSEPSPVLAVAPPAVVIAPAAEPLATSLAVNETAPVVAPSAALRPMRRKAPPAVRRPLPRAEDLFSRH